MGSNWFAFQVEKRIAMSCVLLGAGEFLEDNPEQKKIGLDLRLYERDFALRDLLEELSTMHLLPFTHPAQGVRGPNLCPTRVICNGDRTDRTANLSILR